MAASELEKAQKFAKELEIPQAYGSYEELAKDPEVEICYIGTIHPSHHKNVLMCMNNGKHVVCEKPLGVNAKEVKEMVAMAKEKKVFFLEGMWTRFFPAVQKAREVIESGQIGDVKMVFADFGFKSTPDTKRLYDLNMAGGALLDIGVYVLAAASLAYGGAKPTDIKATGLIGPSGVDEYGSYSLRFADKGVAALTVTIKAETPEVTTYVGTRGYVRLNSPSHAPTSVLVAVTADRGKFDEQTFRYTPPVCPDPSKLKFPGSEGFAYQIKAVEAALASGRTECVEFSHAESVAMAETCDEIRAQLGVKYPMDE